MDKDQLHSEQWSASALHELAMSCVKGQWKPLMPSPEEYAQRLGVSKPMVIGVLLAVLAHLQVEAMSESKVTDIIAKGKY